MRTILFSSRSSPYGGTIRRLRIWLAHLSVNYPLTVIIGNPVGVDCVGRLLEGCVHEIDLIEVQASNRSLVLLRLRAAMHLVRLLWSKQYQTVMPVLPDSDIIGYAAVWLFNRLHKVNIRLVCHCAGSPVPVKMLNTRRGRWYKRVLSFVYRRCDEIVVINETLISHLVTEYGVACERIRVVPIAVECERQSLVSRHSARECYFGVLSRLTPEKSVDHVIRAFAEAREHNVGMHLIVFGEGIELDNLKALVVALRLTDMVEFGGWVADPAAALAQMDCLIVSSKMEGTPRCILEAGCYGVPTVASMVGGIPELIDHGTTGWLYEYGDIAALTKLMCRVCDEPENVRLAGEAIRQIVYTVHSPELELQGIIASWEAQSP